MNPDIPALVPRKHVLYEIKHLASGALYFGITCRNVNQRWAEHLHDAQYGSQHRLHRYLAKYGKSAFSWTVLAEYSNREEAKAAEMSRIKGVRNARLHSLNLTAGGDGIVNLSPESKARFLESQSDPLVKAKKSKAMLKAWRNPEKKAHWKKVQSSSEYRVKMAANSRKVSNDPQKLKARNEAVKKAGEDPERKARHSKMQKARWTPEYRAEFIRRINEPDKKARHTASKQHISAETRSKMSAAAKARWARQREN